MRRVARPTRRSAAPTAVGNDSSPRAQLNPVAGPVQQRYSAPSAETRAPCGRGLVSGTTPTDGLPCLEWHRTFPGKKNQVREVRRWLTSLLTPCAACDDIVLTASELATNAIAHTLSGKAGGQFRVDVTWRPQSVRIAVRDDGGPTTPRVVCGAQEEGQRGLHLIAEIAACWDFIDDADGRVVWAEHPWEAGGGAVPARVPDKQDVAEAMTMLASWFPGVSTWCGLAGWLALVTSREDDNLILADSAADLGWKLAGGSTHPASLPATTVHSWSPPANRTS
jgi:serine/threonine-protein kinase RsbW